MGIRSFGKQAAVKAACLGMGCLAAAGWGQDSWRDLGRPWSATLTAFAACSTSQSAYLLAGSASGRIFRSVDGGDSWTQNPLRMGTDATGFLDLGGGAILAWAGWNRSPLADCWSMDCKDPTLPGGLFRSTDGGLAWTRVGPEHGITAVAALGSSLYAMGRAELYRSADRGATWRKLLRIGTPMTGMERMDGAGNVLVGSAWTFFNRVVLSGDTARWDAESRTQVTGEFLGKHQGFLFAHRAPPGSSPGTPSQLMRSRDGTAWQAVSARRLQRMASSGSRLLGQYLDTLFESADLGATWKVPEAGRLEGAGHRFLAESEGRVYLGGSTAKGLLRLAEGRWAWCNRGLYDRPPGPMLGTRTTLLHADPNLGLSAFFPYIGSEWAAPRIGGLPVSDVTGFAALGGTSLAATFSNTKAYRTDSLEYVRRLGPDGWRADTLGFRAAATGRGWMALFRDGRGILLCEENGAFACRDGAIQDLPLEQYLSTPFTGLLQNRFRAMAASGDSLAIALDSLYISGDRGATFHNLGTFGYKVKWMAFQGGELYAAPDSLYHGSANGLLRLDKMTREWVPEALPGIGEGKRVVGLDCTVGSLAACYLATSDGVYRKASGTKSWVDISRNLPDRNVVGMALYGQYAAVALESGQLMSLVDYVVGTRPRNAPPARAAARKPGPYPLYADPSGPWRRADGRAMKAPVPAPR